MVGRVLEVCGKKKGCYRWLKLLRSTAIAPQHCPKNNLCNWHGRDPRMNNLARVEKRNRLGNSGRGDIGVRKAGIPVFLHPVCVRDEIIIEGPDSCRGRQDQFRRKQRTQM